MKPDHCTCCNRASDGLTLADCGHWFCGSCLWAGHDLDCPECDLAALASLAEDEAVALLAEDARLDDEAREPR